MIFIYLKITLKILTILYKMFQVKEKFTLVLISTKVQIKKYQIKTNG